MSQQADITLNTVVYSSGGTSNGVTVWWNRAAGFAAGFSKLWQTFTQPKTGTQLKLVYQIELPTVATVDTNQFAAGDLMRTSTVQVSAFLAEGSTAAERTDLYLRLKDLVATVAFQAAFKDLNPVYG
ncbi:coat protein [ssRNA phage Gephyllon.3_11]|uniref:Coat protein n=2 Tax=Fiersviridae TaxID=2842319 RepID=A0A8S5L2F8_9VIRU|nr:coat protein [ssRNA phage Gephyllon.3_11]QDH86705.1 MAG: hypothetical protein H3BulkLitter171344_000002 [Leviviridae sp.]DAD51591.1 TPA_asm: coat protein [ssRNA phage Gephyllon.3_11]